MRDELSDVLLLERRPDGVAVLTLCDPTRFTKVALSGGGHRDMDAALRWESLAQPVTMASRDMVGGLTAQREKRRPNFTGE